MKLTPLDIRKQEFSRRVRGVDEEEVKAFLQMIASQWEEIQDEQRRLEDKGRDLENKLQHYKQVEEALQEALRTARENAKDALETARQKAQIIIQEAEATAVHLKRDADDERRKMRRQISRLTQRRDEIVSRLRGFLMSEMELLARFEGDDAMGFIKLMPSQERTSVEDLDELERDHPADERVAAPNTVLALQEPAEPEEPEVEEEPEAPLPAWAQFEGDAEPEGESDAIAAGRPESAEEPAAVVEAAPAPMDQPPATTVQAGPAPPAENQAPDAADHADAADDVQEDAYTSVAVGRDAYGQNAGDAFDAPTYSDGGSVEHDAPAPENAPLPDEPASGAGRSRWLGEHLLSAFRRSDAPESNASHHPASDRIDDHGWESQPADARSSSRADEGPAEEEEEESFTVSSEEVERIRRILKGLD